METWQDEETTIMSITNQMSFQEDHHQALHGNNGPSHDGHFGTDDWNGGSENINGNHPSSVPWQVPGSRPSCTNVIPSTTTTTTTLSTSPRVVVPDETTVYLDTFANVRNPNDNPNVATPLVHAVLIMDHYHEYSGNNHNQQQDGSFTATAATTTATPNTSTSTTRRMQNSLTESTTGTEDHDDQDDNNDNDTDRRDTLATSMGDDTATAMTPNKPQPSCAPPTCRGKRPASWAKVVLAFGLGALVASSLWTVKNTNHPSQLLMQQEIKENDSAIDATRISPNTRWTQLGQHLNGHVDGETFGISLALAANGRVVAAGGQAEQVRVLQYNVQTDHWDALGQEEPIVAISGNKNQTTQMFGRSVSLSENGRILAVGAPGSNTDPDGHKKGRSMGIVQVFVYDTFLEQWIPRGPPLPGQGMDNYFGMAVALSASGNMLAVGAPRNSENGRSAGQVRVFQYHEASRRNNQPEAFWAPMGKAILGSGQVNYFGYSVAMSANGNIVAVGAHRNSDNGKNAGQVRVFKYEKESDEWRQIGQDLNGANAGDEMGRSVSISATGQILATTSYRNSENGFEAGQVRIYQYNSHTQQWDPLGNAVNGESPNDRFGRSVSLSDDGLTMAAGGFWWSGNGPRAGQTRVFHYETKEGSWEQLGRSIQGEAGGDWFGRTVSLASNGRVVAAGGWFNGVNGENAGQVRIFDMIV